MYYRNLLLALSVICFLVLAVTIYHRLAIPCWNDEAAFLTTSKMLRDTGSLVSKEPIKNLAGREVYIHGLWHPPLYLHLLSLAKHDPFVPVTARLIGVACWIVSFTLGVLILTQIRRRGKINDQKVNLYQSCVVFLLINLAVPAITDGMLYIDIDTTVLPVSILAFVLVVVSMRERAFAYNLVLLAGLTCMMLWTKLTTPLFIVVACCFLCISYQRWRAFVTLVAAAALGLALFSFSFLVYCYITKVDIRLMLSMYSSKGSGSLLSWIHSPGILLNSIYDNALWSSPIFIVIVACLAARRFAVLGRRLRPELDSKRWGQDVLLICGLVALLIYPIGFNTTHPKYIYPALLLLSVYIASEVLSFLNQETISHRCFVLMLVVSIITLLVLGVPMVRFDRPWPQLRGLTLFELVHLRELFMLGAFCSLVFTSLYLGIITYKRGNPSNKQRSFPQYLLGLCLAAVLMGMVDIVGATMSKSSFSPLNRYVQSGFNETAQAIGKLSPGLILTRSRPSSFYTKGRLIEVSTGQDVYLREWSASDIRNYGLQLLRARSIDVCVDSTRFPELLISDVDCRNAGMYVTYYGDFYIASFVPVTNLMGNMGNMDDLTTVPTLVE